MTIRLRYTPPLDWAGLLGFLGPRATPGVEHVAGTVYRRTIEVDGRPGVLAATVTPAPTVRIDIAGDVIAGDVARADVVARARRLFDLDAEPATIAARLARCPRL
ncbi:MAG TPA: AlkA N-terminal domain-containing protein, partial [Candidatus Binatia bacterium]|nr:AlkA N-terminal domain-containing protein [Candidatus Binatia bacterium]